MSSNNEAKQLTLSVVSYWSRLNSVEVPKELLNLIFKYSYEPLKWDTDVKSEGVIFTCENKLAKFTKYGTSCVSKCNYVINESDDITNKINIKLHAINGNRSSTYIGVTQVPLITSLKKDFKTLKHGQFGDLLDNNAWIATWGSTYEENWALWVRCKINGNWKCNKNVSFDNYNLRSNDIISFEINGKLKQIKCFRIRNNKKLLLYHFEDIWFENKLKDNIIKLKAAIAVQGGKGLTVELV